MGLNPSDYDLDELRKMARESNGHSARTEDSEPDIGIDAVQSEENVGSTRSFRAGLYRELLPLEAGGTTAKPYLDSLPEDLSGEHLIFEWLEFLLLHAGHQGTREAIAYYESVDWITEECESTLKDYLLGLDEHSAPEPSDLDVDDHLLSLVYIAKLASME